MQTEPCSKRHSLVTGNGIYGNKSQHVSLNDFATFNWLLASWPLCQAKKAAAMNQKHYSDTVLSSLCFYFFLFFFFFFFFWAEPMACGISWTRIDPLPQLWPSCHSDNAGSLTHRAIGELWVSIPYVPSRDDQIMCFRCV